MSLPDTAPTGPGLHCAYVAFETVFTLLHPYQFHLHEPSTMMAKTACSKALLIRLSSEHTAMPNVQILLLCCVNSQTSAYQHGMAYLISASCGHTDKQEVQAGAPVVLPLNNLIIDLGQHVEVVFP